MTNQTSWIVFLGSMLAKLFCKPSYGLALLSTYLSGPILKNYYWYIYAKLKKSSYSKGEINAVLYIVQRRLFLQFK